MESDGAMLDAVVVGAGPAGLGVSHALLERGLRHQVVERGRIGETWRSQRWDSFRMNTPNVQTVMPGDRYEGTDPEGFMTRDAFVALLEDFARRHGLPIETDNPVTGLTRSAARGGYRLETGRGPLHARNVVIASGSLNRPRRPAVAAALPPDLLQLDAYEYRNPASLPAGAVLVIGSAQSGGQIAEDLLAAGRTVFLSTCRVGRNARSYRGRDILLWLEESGLFDLPRADFTEASGHVLPRPLLGAVRTISLQSLSARGVVLLGRFTGVAGSRLGFADDLEANLRFGDETSATIKRQIDDYIARRGLEAPPAADDPDETVAPRLPDPPIRSLGWREQGIATLIWCTGFGGDFGWVRLPGVLDDRGRPRQADSVAPVPGIYFAGIDFAATRRSGTLLAVAGEAQRIAERIALRRSYAFSF
jgi:putative flavoprotein involved in K+ transport